MKIGVLADTHIPDRRRSLPARILEIFSSVELVLHAGDLTRLELLQQLRDSFGTVFAVYGQDDHASIKSSLQESQILEFGPRRIALVHGDGEPPTGLSQRWRGLIGRKRDEGLTANALLERFQNVDAIVFGQTHLPYARTHGGIFLFNPGSLVPLHGPPSVGLLEMDAHGIGGRIIPV